MKYERKLIAPEEIRRQEEICGEIFEKVTADGRRPLAMVDTYGCQQNEADSEKLRGYLAEMGYGFTQDEFQADVVVVNTCAVREHAEMRVLGNVGALNHSKKAGPRRSSRSAAAWCNRRTSRRRSRSPIPWSIWSSARTSSGAFRSCCSR